MQNNNYKKNKAGNKEVFREKSQELKVKKKKP
jgi:hypothetical protein